MNCVTIGEKPPLRFYNFVVGHAPDHLFAISVTRQNHATAALASLRTKKIGESPRVHSDLSYLHGRVMVEGQGEFAEKNARV
jgi:hypothetical protein